MLQVNHQHQLALRHVKQGITSLAGFGAHAPHWPAFEKRLDEYFPTLLGELVGLYGEREDFLEFLSLLCLEAWNGWLQRPADLRALDDRREEEPDWFQSSAMLGGVCYADLYAGGLKGLMAMIPYFKELGLTYLHIMPPFKCPAANSDGGYAVSSYREVNPVLGNMQDLKDLAAALRKEGISLVLDFIFNHTSNEHDWATAAVQGDEHYKDFYYIYPDRQTPDAYDRTLREIFPDQHPGGFSQLPDGRWIWTTFNTFQWDLNYANPAVFTAMAGEMLSIANIGAEFLRMDAVAFIWKQMGTTCESLPQAHALIRAFNAVCRIASPSLLFKSEAIVHPDDVVKYIAPNECQISYNPLQMALLWNTLATREVNLLQQALEERHHIADGTTWVNYVRSHDDIGWTFADEDAIQFGINGFDHRQFLNRFYVNRFEGSFARGVPFQDNPVTNDCRISGTCASLAGLEQHDAHAVARILLMHSVALSSGGIPLIYLGDEVGTLNDPSFAKDASKAADSRWVHRPARDVKRYTQRADASTDAGRIYQGLRNMIDARKLTPAFSGGQLTGFRTGNASVLGYLRLNVSGNVLVLCNFSEYEQRCGAAIFSEMPAKARDILSGNQFTILHGLALAPYAVLWLLLA